MRFLHLADLHIGKRLHRVNLIENQRYMLERIIHLIEEQNVDALLLAGDIYDVSNPSEEAVSCVSWFLTELSSRGIPVFITAGNHDSAERIAYLSGLLEKQRIFVSPVFDGNVACHTLKDEFGVIRIWLFPFVRPTEVRLAFSDYKIESTNDALKVLVNSLPINKEERNIALVHQFVCVQDTNPETSDSEIGTLGTLDAVDSHIFDDFDYVALGHIHKSQAMGRKTCRYSGSLLKYSFSEARKNKEFPLITLGKKEVKREEEGTSDSWIDIETIYIAPLRDLRCIEGVAQDLIDAAEADESCDDYFEVTLLDEHIDEFTRKSLYECYPNILNLRFDNTYTRAQGITTAADESFERKTLEEQFSDFFALQCGSELSSEQQRIVEELLIRKD